MLYTRIQINNDVCTAKLLVTLVWIRVIVVFQNAIPMKSHTEIEEKLALMNN